MTIIFASIAIPGIVGLYTTVLNNSQDAEIMTVATLLASEQMEKILADKAGTGEGFGYAAINTAKYASVQPGAPFNGYTRSVTVTVVNSGAQNEYKRIVVTVGHSTIPSIVLTGAVSDHTGI
ncbi:MAG: hypothetical protein V2A61_00475 [Calditrichota bacterium]